MQRLAAASAECSECLNSANRVAYSRLDRVFAARGNGAFRLDPPRFFKMAAGFSQGEVKAPDACCRAARDVISSSFQNECACRADVAQHTKNFDKELLDYYVEFLSRSCGFEGQAGMATSWRACGADATGFVFKAQEAVFAPLSLLAGAAQTAAGAAAGAAGAAAGVAKGAAGAAVGAASGAAGAVAGVAGGAARAAASAVPLPFGHRRLQQQQQQCAVGGDAQRVDQNNAAAPFYFLCPPDKGHCAADGKCVFGRTAAVPKGQWATCAPLANCDGNTAAAAGGKGGGGQRSGCFPGAATVRLQGGAKKAVSALKVGDKVLAVGADGALAYEDVYFFGHRDGASEAEFVRLELKGGASLELTPDHFVPVLPAGASGGGGFKRARMAYARDVKAGDLLLVAPRRGDAGAAPEAAAVARVRSVRRKGLFNPYTMGGAIVVDGVVASAHSGWLIDGAAARLRAGHLLPAFFQAAFAPLRALYALLGAARMQAFGDALASGALRLEAAVLRQGGSGNPGAGAALALAGAGLAAAAGLGRVARRAGMAPKAKQH